MGIISDKLKNGDTIEMVYEDGLLKKSQRKGSVNFSKVFKYNPCSNNLNNVITERQDGFTEASYSHRVMNGKLSDFDLFRNDEKIASLCTNKVGKLRTLSGKEGVQLFWGHDGKLECVSTTIPKDPRSNPEVFVRFKDGEIALVKCHGFINARNKGGKLVLENRHVTVIDAIETLAKVGLQNAIEITNEIY